MINKASYTQNEDIDKIEVKLIDELKAIENTFRTNLQEEETRNFIACLNKELEYNQFKETIY